MSQKNITTFKDLLSMILSIITVSSVIFYGGRIVELVDAHEKRISRIEMDLYFNKVVRN